jgi:hypothetical protein
MALRPVGKKNSGLGEGMVAEPLGTGRQHSKE